MGNHLSILMKVFSISSKNLSELMHIDSSLISKWRSGKRILKPKSVYVNKISDYIMELDKQNNYMNVCELLSNQYENIYSRSEKEIGVYLKTWLTSENDQTQKSTIFDELRYSDSIEIGMVYKFKDNGGRRKAVKFQQEYTLINAPGLEIWSYTEEDVSWLYDDPDYLNEWSTNLHRSVQNGNQIKIIHPMGRSYEDTAVSILKWMPLHMTGKTHAFYIPKYTDEPLKYTVFLVPNQMAVFNISSTVQSKVLNTYLTNDASILDNLQNILQAFFDVSIPIFKQYTFKLKAEYLDYLIGVLETKKMKYIYSSTFLFMPMSEGLIREILLYNHATEAQITKYKEQYRIISMLNVRSLSRYLINFEQIRNQINQDNVILDRLSFIMGKTITVPRTLFTKIVYESIDKIQSNDNLEIGITDNTMLRDLGNINIFVQEFTCAQFSSAAQEAPLSLVTKELTILTAVFQKLEKIWYTIPRLNRNKDFVCKQIKELFLTTNTQKADIYD